MFFLPSIKARMADVACFAPQRKGRSCWSSCMVVVEVESHVTPRIFRVLLLGCWLYKVYPHMYSAWERDEISRRSAWPAEGKGYNDLDSIYRWALLKSKHGRGEYPCSLPRARAKGGAMGAATSNDFMTLSSISGYVPCLVSLGR